VYKAAKKRGRILPSIRSIAKVKVKNGTDAATVDMSVMRMPFGDPVRSRSGLVPVQAVQGNLDDGMSPDDVAKAYRIDLRLVTGARQFAESQGFAHSV
jgi:uncharacterized protein (DUF433 family)